MSQKSYARGFCKYAQDNGMDPKALASFALKMAAGDLVDPVGEGMKDAAGSIDQAMSGTAERIDDAMSSIGDYADAHPILGGAALGASAPIASGAKSVGSVTAPIGALALSPLSVVTGPAGASSAASSGGDVAEGSAIGSAAPAMAGGAITGSVGASAGGLVGSALSPVTAPIGASAGASAGAADAEFKKTVEEERKRMEESQKTFRDRALDRIIAEREAAANNAQKVTLPRLDKETVEGLKRVGGQVAEAVAPALRIKAVRGADFGPGGAVTNVVNRGTWE